MIIFKTTAAWVIATQLGAHSSPFFAPIAAAVALSFGRGERGRSALRLLAGVGIGIVSGELMILLLGGGHWSFALAVLIAAVAARLLGQNRLLRNQAAAAAILTVAIANGEAGYDRLLDAFIGVAVALVFTQVLFSPEPVALVRRAEATTIASMSQGLALRRVLLPERPTRRWPYQACVQVTSVFEVADRVGPSAASSVEAGDTTAKPRPGI